MKPSTAHPEIIPVLQQHGVTWEQFSRKGRLPHGLQWLVEKRRQIITELHLSGMPWGRMMEVTGLSLGAIERGTRAAWNPASRENRRASAARVGRAGRGGRKPWLSAKLRQDWVAGVFDFHRGRIRSEQEKEALRAALRRPEVRAARVSVSIKIWQRPEHRAALLAYHRREDVRRARSRAQTQRMLSDPGKWSRGKGAYAEPKKCLERRIWTRSSYERIALALLDADPNVSFYEYEPRIELADGRWILPDFVVTYKDGATTLLEIKASWVLSLPSSHKVQKRLNAAASFAHSQGWNFRIWTEVDFNAGRC